MSIVKLDQSHSSMCKSIFTHSNYMGFEVSPDFNNMLFDRFCNTYLFGLHNFHCYGFLEDNDIKALISFYESDEDPSWFYTLYRSTGNNNLLKLLLDKVIDHNEKNGRLKFYSLVNADHGRLLRKFHWSQYNDNRYGYFDEYIVPKKNKCFYTTSWELLFKRSLLPTDTLVRCNYLKQEFRTVIPVAGNI